MSDLRAACRAGPSANSIAEILLCCRGATAIICHRIAHALRNQGARIGESSFIGHGTGAVIGETAVVGRHVYLSQTVTLGAQPSLSNTREVLTLQQPRHPIIEDDVIIHAGATILGRVTVGNDSIIGGNVWLTESVPPGSIITRAQTQLA